VNSTHIVTRSSSIVSPDHARITRAKVWLYVFDCYEKNKEDAPNDGTTSKEDAANGHIIQ
jgi:hypothetical protein